MTIELPINLNEQQLQDFGAEMDEIYRQTMADLGEKDQRYIRRLIRFQRSLAFLSRMVIFASLAFLPNWWDHAAASWWAFGIIISLGTLGLGVAKILENMEIGHNVMHGQWDWMHDPQINSTTWEWDNVCPSDQWKHSHNVVHHTWTNVIGKDRDIGYEIMRISEKQRWHPFYLTQPVINVLLMLLFEWGVGSHDLKYQKLLKGNAQQKAEQKALLRAFGRKALRQSLKDYLLWPLLAGAFLFLCAGGQCHGQCGPQYLVQYHYLLRSFSGWRLPV